MFGQAPGGYSVAFSSDGKTLAAGSVDNSVQLWDVATHKPLGSLTRQPLGGHIAASLAFSDDSKTLASGSDDGSVRLWDVAARQALGEPLVGHADSVLSMAFSPDGKILASASSDKSVRLWDVDMGSWRNRACRIASRNLSQADWVEAMGTDVPYQHTCPDLPPGM